MNDMNKQLPYKPLGAILRHLRERNRESVAEVSGAVEIDETALGRIEAGSERPSEDILLLLISHFSVEDDKAANQKGVVLNFSQNAGQNEQPLTIARIGMSREQAKLVMGVLHQALYDLENPRRPRQLGDGTDRTNNK
jgi:transcriptional regulator with XRE-family HTH domain